MPREEQGPPEMALDDDSDSESSSSSSSSSNGDSSSSSGGGEKSNAESSISKQAKIKVEEKEEATKKRKRKGADSDDESEEESDDSDSDSDEEEEEEDSDDGEDTDDEIENSEDAKDDDTPIASITKAQKDPIYIHPRAESKAGFKHRSCYLCPMAVLKTERSVTVHLEGSVSFQKCRQDEKEKGANSNVSIYFFDLQSHGRHLKRFAQYCETKLKEDEKQDPSKGGLNARQVVERIEKVLQVKSEKQIKHRQLVRQAKKEAKGKRMAAKKERKQKAKEEKEARKQALLAMKGVPDENGKIKHITEDGETVRARKRQKAKRQKKLTFVMPPKAERKAAKKERKALKVAARKELAIKRTREGAAKNKAAAAGISSNGKD